MHGVGAEAVAGVANLGRRPTVNGLRVQLEVHLFDFQQDIYGRHVQVEFLAFLRPEQRFDSLDALQRQIQADSTRARAFLADPARRP
jgi:riboflavin kinase/FMN adenylyltransferase